MLLPQLMQAQSQMKEWCLPNQLYSFTQSTSSALPLGSNPGDYDGTPSAIANHVYYTADQSLLLFATKEGLFDANGENLVVPTEWVDPSIDNEQLFGEVSIIPVPEECDKYYVIFTTARYNTDNLARGAALKYLIVDMSIPAGSASRIKDYGSLLITGSSGQVHGAFLQFAITPYLEKSDFTGHYLYVYGPDAPTNSNRLLRKFNITSSGISQDASFTVGGLPVLSGLNSYTFSCEGEVHQLEDGSFLAAFRTEPDKIGVFSLNANGYFTYAAGSNPRFIDLTNYGVAAFSEEVQGLEFSADGQSLYFTCTRSDTTSQLGYINYVDLTQSTLAAQPLSYSQAIDYRYGFIEKGIPDATTGHTPLYFASATGLGRLINSNDPTSTWTPGAISITLTPHTVYHYGLARTVYCVPDQVDQQDYDDIFPIGYTVTSFTATTSATWQPGSNPFNSASGKVYIDKELIIPAGVSITVQDMELHMGKDARILVQANNSLWGNGPGGRLTLRNTTCLAGDLCEENPMWQGIEVWGSANVGLFTDDSKNGQVLITDGSLIRDAHYGALSGQFLNGFPQSKLTGGRIRVENATFLNNRVGIHMRGYAGYPGVPFNYSYCKDATFRIDGPLKNPAVQPFAHIHLLSSSVIDFSGCTFEDTRTGITNPADRVMGILAQNSIFDVQQSAFNGLEYGIYAQGIKPTTPFYTHQSTFTENWRGIYASGLDMVSLRENDFTTSTTYWGTYGCYLDACSKFEVQRNNFQHPPAEGTSTWPIGIVIRNSSVRSDLDPNKISRNSFSNLYIGTMVLDDNEPGSGHLGEPQNDPGLQMLCGNYLGNTIDFYVPTGSSINDPQGRCELTLPKHKQFPAGNLFSHMCPSGSGQWPIYPDYLLGSGEPPEQTSYHHTSDVVSTPLCYSPKLIRVATCGTFDSDKCEEPPYDRFATTSLPQIKSEHAAATDSLNSHTDTSSRIVWGSHRLWLADRVIAGYLLDDTSTYALDSALHWAISHQMSALLPSLYITKGNYTYANAFADTIALQFNYTDYGDYFSILAQLHQDTLPPNQLDSTDISVIETMANDSTSEVQAWARNLMSMARGDSYAEKLVYPEDSSGKRGYQETYTHSLSLLYPNPATHQVHIRWDNPKATSLLIEIWTLQGTLIRQERSALGNGEQVIDVSSLSSGMYIVKLQDDTGQNTSTKLMVQ